MKESFHCTIGIVHTDLLIKQRHTYEKRKRLTRQDLTLRAKNGGPEITTYDDT